MEQPHVNVKRNSGITVVELTGEHDLSTVSDVERALGAIGSAERYLIDLSGASFVDSSILRLLIRTASDPEATGWLGVVAPPGTAAARLLELTSAAGLMPVHASLEAAAHPA